MNEITKDRLKIIRTRQFLRRELARKFGWKCQYCYKPLTKDTATLDHIKPQKFGGEDTLENTQLLCGKCNNKRNKLDKHFPEELWIENYK